MNIADGSVPSPAVESARAGDLTSIQWLLDLESLPNADRSETALEHFLVVRDEIDVVGVVGLEAYRKVALLRSWLSPTRMPVGVSGEGWSWRLNRWRQGWDVARYIC